LVIENGEFDLLLTIACSKAKKCMERTCERKREREGGGGEREKPGRRERARSGENSGATREEGGVEGWRRG